jgi:phage tail-like protein
MPEFAVNTHRFDPYKNFKFRLVWDGRPIAGISKVSGLRRTTDVVHHRDGADPSKLIKGPGITHFAPLTIERGVTHDIEFEGWANKVYNLEGSLGAESSLRDLRKDIRLELHNEAGQVVLAYNIYRCWPSEFEALPELDANASGVAIQTLVLQYEYWERDYDVAEPTEPSFDIPA